MPVRNRQLGSTKKDKIKKKSYACKNAIKAFAVNTKTFVVLSIHLTWIKPPPGYGQAYAATSWPLLISLAGRRGI
jgi:hypothetical protein